MAGVSHATLVVRAVNTEHMGFYSDALINLRHSNVTRMLPPLAFPARLYRAELVENSPVGPPLDVRIVVGQARLYGDALNYRTHPADVIGIDDDGLLTTVGAVDLEALRTTPAGIYRVDVLASNGTHEAKTKLEVKVHDVNEFTPHFERSEYDFSVDEVCFS